MFPFYPVDRNVACLTHDVKLFGVVSEPLQQFQAALVTQCTQSFGSLVAAHGVLVLVLEYMAQRIYRSIVARLAKAIRQLVFQ